MVTELEAVDVAITAKQKRNRFRIDQTYSRTLASLKYKEGTVDRAFGHMPLRYVIKYW